MAGLRVTDKKEIKQYTENVNYLIERLGSLKRAAEFSGLGESTLQRAKYKGEKVIVAKHTAQRAQEGVNRLLSMEDAPTPSSPSEVRDAMAEATFSVPNKRDPLNLSTLDRAARVEKHLQSAIRELRACSEFSTPIAAHGFNYVADSIEKMNSRYIEPLVNNGK